jgi:hypothetical protein
MGSPDQGVVAAAARLEEPAAHRSQHRAERVERFLERGESAQRPVEPDGLARPRRGGEGRDQLDALAGHQGEPVAQGAQVVRPRGRLERAERSGEARGVRGEARGELGRARRKEMTLDPLHPIERGQQRRQQRVRRLRDGHRVAPPRPASVAARRR